MKYPVIRYIYNRRKSEDPNKRATVEIEVYLCRKRKYISTGIRVLPHQWDPEKHVVRRPDAALLNMRLDAVRRPIDNYINSLIAAGEPFSFDGLDQLLRSEEESASFRDFVAERIEARTDIREVTRKSHRSLIPALEAFGRIDTFDSLTPANVRAFDEWLHGLRKPDGSAKYTQTSVAKYHKFMKCYINEAIVKGFIGRNPYLGFRVDKGKSKTRKYLTAEELHRIERYETDNIPLIRARDLFVLQCYTGLAYADLMSTDFTNVERRGGKSVLVGKRRKTDEPYYIVLLSPALKVLEKYDYRLPVISNQKYNMALKALGVVIGRNLTSHMGRHTAATMFLNKGMSLELVAKVLGHTNTKQTAEYAKLVNKSVENAFDRLQRELDGE